MNIKEEICKLKNRKCDNCEYYSKCEIEAMLYDKGIATKDFSCNQWERREG